MAILGTCPVGAPIVGSFGCSDSIYLNIQPVGYYVEPIVPTNIVVAGKLYTAPLAFDIEIPDININQVKNLVVDGLDLVIDPTFINISSRHNLVIPENACRYEISDLSIIQETKLVLTNVDINFEIDSVDVVQITAAQTSGINIPVQVEVPLPITQTHNLKIEPSNIHFTMDNIWMFLPQKCFAYGTAHTIDGGLLINRISNSDISTDRWFDRDLYSITFKWQGLTGEEARAIDGFFISTKFDVFITYYPVLKKYFFVMLSNDPTINQAGHKDDWEAELPMIGQEITLDHPRISSLVTQNGWTKITPAEIGQIAIKNNYRVLVY